MNKTVRTRFAPSPTGYLHLGGLRTALFNWLWAKKMSGEFILRLEDTDQTRLVPGAAEQLMLDLQSLDLDWDFGPDKPHPQFGSCIQSQRLAIYQEVVEQLLNKNIAYKDYTTPEQLEDLRQAAKERKQAFIFRREMAQLQATPQNPNNPVIRISMPPELTISWQDVVKGEQTWQSHNIGDFIALKSNGWPTYQLANVIDDHLMQISHVIRADEWLSSTPKHLYLFDCLNWERPTYVHVPAVLMHQGGKKLSKRDQSSRVTNFLKEGYLKEALINYLSLLGWNPKTDQEFFTVNELIQVFDIQNIQVSGARFDPVRLDWFNGRHLRALSATKRQQQAEHWWPEQAKTIDQAYKNKILDLMYQRLKKWSELTELTDFFFQQPAKIDLDTLSEMTKLPEDEIVALIGETLEILKTIEFNTVNLETNFYQLTKTKGVSPSKYFTLLRFKLTGKKVSPGLFETMNVLGLEQCRQRLNK